MTGSWDLALALNQARDIDLDLDSCLKNVAALGLARDFDQAHDFVLTRQLAPARARALELNHDLDIVLDRARELELAVERDRTRGRDRVRIRDLQIDLARVRGQARALGLGLGIDRAYALAKARESAQATGKEQAKLGTSAQATGKDQARIARHLVAAATRLLPSADRPRYLEEFRAELADLAQARCGRMAQAMYGVRLLTSVLRLRAELQAPRRRGAPQ